MFGLQTYLIAGAAAVALILATYGVGYYKGGAACKESYAQAALDLSTKARETIVKTNKKHEAVKYEIIQTTGENPVAGKRVTLAIDSLPN